MLPRLLVLAGLLASCGACGRQAAADAEMPFAASPTEAGASAIPAPSAVDLADAAATHGSAVVMTFQATRLGPKAMTLTEDGVVLVGGKTVARFAGHRLEVEDGARKLLEPFDLSEDRFSIGL
jgi:hypothetical protein